MEDAPTRDIRLLSQYKLSDCLSSRYPFPSPAPYDATLATTAWGRRSIEKILDVLGYFLKEGTGEREETVKIQENIKLLEEQLGNQTQKLLAIAAGGVDINTQLLDHKDPVVRKLAARVLGRLATEREGRTDICALGCVEKLCALLRDRNSSVRQAASVALRHTAASEEAQRLLVQMEEVVPSIVEALPGLKDTTLCEALMTLANLCRFPEACFATPWSAIVTHVVKAMGSTNESAADAATRCLVCIAGHPEGKVAAIEAEAIPALVPLLAHDRIETRRMAGSALLVLVVNSEAKVRAGPCLDNLIKMLYSDDLDVAMNGLLGLRSIAESPKQREEILKKLLGDVKMYERVFKDQKIHLAANRYM